MSNVFMIEKPDILENHLITDILSQVNYLKRELYSEEFNDL